MFKYHTISFFGENAAKSKLTLLTDAAVTLRKSRFYFDWFGDVCPWKYLVTLFDLFCLSGFDKAEKPFFVCGLNRVYNQSAIFSFNINIPPCPVHVVFSALSDALRKWHSSSSSLFIYAVYAKNVINALIK